MGVIEWATVLLVLLKLCGFIRASWWLVLAPAMLACAFGFVRGFIREFNRLRKGANDGRL